MVKWWQNNECDSLLESDEGVFFFWTSPADYDCHWVNIYFDVLVHVNIIHAVGARAELSFGLNTMTTSYFFFFSHTLDWHHANYTKRCVLTNQVHLLTLNHTVIEMQTYLCSIKGIVLYNQLTVILLNQTVGRLSLHVNFAQNYFT